MRFLAPEWLSLLIILPLMLLFWLWRGRARLHALRRLGDPELIGQLVRHVHWHNRRLRQMLTWLAMLCLCLAIARPFYGMTQEQVEVQSQQVIFLVDVSLSMDATDTPPSRLERAKLDMLALLPALDAQVAIVLFAAEPYAYMPFTDDRLAVMAFIESINTSAVTQQGTHLPNAIVYALSLFDEQPELLPRLFLFSDGENHEGDVRQAHQLLQERQVRLYSFGYGTTQGSLIPLYDAFGSLLGYKTDAQNRLVETRLNDALLSELAIRSGGRYFPPTTALEWAEDTAQQNTSTVRQRVFSRPNEWFPLFVLAAFLLLVAQSLLPETRARGGS